MAMLSRNSILISLLLAAATFSCKSKEDSKAKDSPAEKVQSAAQDPNKATARQGADGEKKSDAKTDEADSLPRPSLPSTDSEPLPLDPRVQTGTLANGMRYYIQKNQKPEKRAEFWLAVNAGSFHEDDDQQGLAHFLEHMAFNGTKSFPKNELVAKLESLGARFGAHLNAYTSFDETVYKLQLPTDKAENIELGLKILSEWSSSISLDPSEFEKERGVVLSEKRGGEGPEMRLMQTVIEKVFAGTRYANRLPIGIPKVLKKAPISAIQRFYKDWYHPANMAVFVVGDVDPAAIEKEIKEKFGAIPAAKNPRKAPERTLPVAKDLTYLALQDKELPITAVGLGRLTPNTPSKTIKDTREDYAEILATLMVAKRLEALQKQGKAEFMMAAGSPTPLVRPAMGTVFFAMVSPDKAQAGMKQLMEEIERANRHGFTAPELERINKEIHAMVLSKAKDSHEGKEKSGELMESLIRYHLEGEITSGALTDLALIEKLAKEITLDEVNSKLKGFLNPEGLVVLAFGSALENSLNEKSVRALLKELPKAELEAYSEEGAGKALLASVPTPAKVTKREHNKSLDLHSLHFENGAQVHLKKTDFAGDEVLFFAASPGGRATLGKEKLAAARNVSELIEKSGLGEFDALSLQRALAGKQLSLSPFVGEAIEGLRGTSTSKDIEELLQLAHLHFTGLRFDAKAFDVMKKNWIDSLAQAGNKAEQQFQWMLGDAVANGDPRYQRWDAKTAELVDFEASKAFAMDRFQNPGDFHFYLVGNIDLEQAEKLVSSYIGSIPDQGRREKFNFHPWAPVDKATAVNLKAGTQPRASIVLRYESQRDAALPPLKERLAMEVFGRALGMHLIQLFREELGDTYSPQARASWNEGWSRASLSMYMQVEPGKSDKVVKRAESELQSMLEKGVDAQHFENAKLAMLKENEVALKQNNHWRRALVRMHLYGASVTEIADYAEELKSLSSEEMMKIVKTYILPEKRITALLLPKK